MQTLVSDRQFDTRFTESFFVGMNDRLPSHELPNGVFQLLDNVLITDNKIVKRPGNSGSTAIAGSQNMLGSVAFERSNGSKSQIVCLNGASNAQLYESTNGTTFVAIGSANLTKDAQMNFVVASDRVFGFNGTDVVDYDGATVTKNRATVPLGKFGFWFHNYLFVAGVSGYPNRLFWSDLGTPTAFTGANFVDINANDGDAITALNGFINAGNDQLLVFKNNSMGGIEGFSGSTFSATTIAGQNTSSINFGFGTPSHRSVLTVGKNVYYLSFVGGIPHIRMLERSLYGTLLDAGIVSYEIETTMNGLNKSNLSKVAGVYDGKYCYWALPSGSSTTNNILVQMWHDKLFQTSQGPMRSWVKNTSGFTVDNFFLSTLSGRAKIYWSDASTSGKVFLIDPSIYTDNGTPIVSEVRSRDYVGDPIRKTKWRYVPLKYDTGSAGTLVVNARIEKADTFANQATISLAGSSPGLGSFILGTSLLGGSATSRNTVTLQHLTGTLFGLQFKESTNNGLTMYDYQILGNKKGFRSNM
jgi:hypothetical protein